MIDKALIKRKFNLIARDMERLRPISHLGWKEYSNKFEYEILSERYLERIITRMIDVNYHIITEISNKAPEDYGESFKMMGKIKILPMDFAEHLVNAAGLRNRLVHEYDEINPEKIYKALKRCFRDIPVYLKKVNKFINKNNKQKKLL